MNPISKLLSSENQQVKELGILIEQIHHALENKTITQAECDELIADTSRIQKLLDDSISLDLRIAINKALGELYDVALAAKNLLPL